MAYTRDSDYMTRGVGAIAAADHLRTRRDRRVRVAAATQARDRALGAVARGALGLAASPALTPGMTYTAVSMPSTPSSRAIASRDVSAATVKSVIGRGTVDHRHPVTDTPVAPPPPAPVVAPPPPPSADTPPRPRPQDPVVTKGGGAATTAATSSSSSGGGAAGVPMGPRPPVPAASPLPSLPELPDLPAASDNTTRNLLLLGAAGAIAAYFLFRRRSA